MFDGQLWLPRAQAFNYYKIITRNIQLQYLESQKNVNLERIFAESSGQGFC